jgi:hypothetical protein
VVAQVLSSHPSTVKNKKKNFRDELTIVNYAVIENFLKNSEFEGENARI